MATSNKSGVGRGKPKVRAGHNPNGDQSIDDDATQRPEQVTGFTTQAMIIANSTTNPFQMIV
jgi:hypothetical protein